MIELLYSILTVFGICLIPYFLLASFQYMRILFFVFQFIVWIIAISIKDYKNHYLWDNLEFQPIHNISYPPINKLYNNSLSFDTLESTFSINESDGYSKKCFENYFIPNDKECPITDIIVENSNSNNHLEYSYAEIYNNYIYYKRDINNGKLYKSFHKSQDSFVFDYEYTYEDIEKIKRLEENKLKNPYKHFKNYYIPCDVICLILYIFSLIYYFMESKDDKKWNYFKVIDYGIQIIMFMLHTARFAYFCEIKRFFKKNKDIYQEFDINKTLTNYNINYYPKSYTIQSFPLSISLAIIVYFILFYICPNKWSFQKKEFSDKKYNFLNDENGSSNIKYRVFIFSIPFIIAYFICFIMDCINDNNIEKVYTNTIHNWDLDPIISIENNNNISHKFGYMTFDKKKYAFYKWKGDFYKVKRDEKYNYLNIYTIKPKEGKLCGTDNLGNKLYFPKDAECPINDISTNYIDGYIRGGYDFYYTNKNINGKIIIDIKAGPSSVPLQLNYGKSNEICDYLYNKSFFPEKNSKKKNPCAKYYKFNKIPFYKKIDKDDFSNFLRDTFKKMKNIIIVHIKIMVKLLYMLFIIKELILILL